jgi:hypothetical protein
MQVLYNVLYYTQYDMHIKNLYYIYTTHMHIHVRMCTYTHTGRCLQQNRKASDMFAFGSSLFQAMRMPVSPKPYKAGPFTSQRCSKRDGDRPWQRRSSKRSRESNVSGKPPKSWWHLLYCASGVFETLSASASAFAFAFVSVSVSASVSVSVSVSVSLSVSVSVSVCVCMSI